MENRVGQPFSISPELTERLRVLCRRSDVTPPIALAGSWLVLFGRWSGQDSLSIEAPSSGSPLNIFLQDDFTVAGLLARVSAAGSVPNPIRIRGEDGGDELRVQFDHGPGQISGALEYTGELFRSVTPDHVIECWKTLLDGMIAGVELPISRLPLVSASERERLLHRFNDTTRTFPHEKTIHRVFEEQAERAPQSIALVSDTHELTYAQMNLRANQLARHLVDHGVRRGDCIPIVMPRSVDLLVAQLALLKSGAAYVPIDPDLPAARRAFLIRDCGTRCALGPPALRAGLEHEEIAWIDPQSAGPEIQTLPSGNLDLPIDSLSPAYVMYTSGSTGVPKGVVVSHRGVNRLAINSGFASIDSRDRIAHCSNPAFDASTFEVWSALLNGAAVCIVSQAVFLEPALFAAELRKQRVTVLWLTSGLFTQYADALGDVFGQLRYLLAGGDVLDPTAVARVLRRNPPKNLLNGYGPTECTTFSTTYRIASVEETTRSIPIGRPIGNTQVHILDRNLELVPVGVVGEIHIGGPGVALGYLNRDALTRERFIADPFGSGGRLYRSGDLGRWSPDGVIEFVGRKDSQVKLRGFRIEPGEIEAALLRQPQITQAVVVAREESPGDKRLVAYLVIDSKVADSTERRELIARVREQLHTNLPAYMVPGAFVLLNHLPLTPNGKVDRRALPAPDVDAFVGAAYERPKTLIEESLAQLYAEVLHVTRVGRRDSFFDLGGESLAAIKLMAAIAARLGASLTVQTLYGNPVLRDLASAIESALATRDEIPLRRRSDGAAVPLTAKQRFLWESQFARGARPGVRTTTVMSRVNGPLDVDRLRSCVRDLVARHEALRTRIVSLTDHPEQCIDAQTEGYFEVARVPDVAPDLREQAVARLVRAFILEPVDIAIGPLFKAKLFTMSAHESVLVLACVRLIADGVSAQQLDEELWGLYEGVEQRGAAALPPANLQLADYAVWEQQTSAAWKRKHESYWRALFARDVPVVLPYDGSASATGAPLGAMLRVPFGIHVTAALRDVARREETLLPLVVLAICAAAMSCWCDRKTLPITFVSNGRDQPELVGMVGNFASHLYLELSFGEEDRLSTVLEQVKQQYALALDHQDRGRAAAFLPGYAARHFGSELYFNWLADRRGIAGNAQSRDSGLTIEPYPLSLAGETVARFATDFSESAAGIGMTVRYRTDLFHRETLDRFCDALRSFAAAFAGDLRTPCSSVLADERAARARVGETARA